MHYKNKGAFSELLNVAITYNVTFFNCLILAIKKQTENTKS